ncbi:MAG TPA: hypothetical protein VGL35_00715 [Rhizomicrobium sp.]|jgi:hypothetical protein
MTADESRLDRLLAAPLASVEDRGFSASVMARIAGAEEQQTWLETAALTTAAGLFLAFLSASGFSEWIGRLGYSLASSLPLAIAALALALTFSCARILAE